MKLTLIRFLCLLFQAKKQGKGKIGNGRILIMLLSVITDSLHPFHDKECRALRYFTQLSDMSTAFHAVDKRIGKFIQNPGSYPYGKLHFTSFEHEFHEIETLAPYLQQMETVCNAVFDPDKTDELVHGIIALLRADTCFTYVLYGSRYLPKATITGTQAHPSKLYLPALILGFLYQLHFVNTEDSGLDILPVSSLPKTFFLIPVSQTVWRNPELLKDILNPALSLSLMDMLYSTSETIALPEQLHPVELKYNHETVSELPEDERLFLYGMPMTGKSTYLRQYMQQLHTVFYLEMAAFHAEIKETAIHNFPFCILYLILEKYRYHGAYSTYRICIAHETENTVLDEMEQLNHEFTNRISSSPQYCLILDNLNETPVFSYDSMLNELAWISDHWHNVRIIVAGRTVPMYDTFRKYSQVQCMGDPLIPSAVSRINAKDFTNEIDKCFSMEHLHSDREKTLFRFVLQCILPFIAFHMVHSGRKIIERAIVSELTDSAIQLYLNTDGIYQNYTVTQGIYMDKIKEDLRHDLVINILLNHLCILRIDPCYPQEMYFTDRKYHRYFAALYVHNAINALDASYHYYDSVGTEPYFRLLQLGEIWFPPEEKEAYRMLGELLCDEWNDPCPEDYYQHTKLNTLLDWARSFYTYRLTENVITTMAMIRNNVLCDIDFRGLQLPIWIPAYIKFSNNGHDPCRFNGSSFGVLGLYDGEILYRYSNDHTYILLHWIEDSYTITIDLKTKQMLAEQTNDDAFEGLPVSELDTQLFKELMGNLPHFRYCNLSVASFLCSQSNFHHI